MWGQKRAERRRSEDQRRERNHFEHQLRYTLGAGHLTVALTRLNYRERYTFENPLGGGPDLDKLRQTFPEEAAPCFFGVVHEEYGRLGWQHLEKWIQVRVWLPRRRSTSPHVGAMAIEALRGEGDILNRQLCLSASIGDEAGSMFAGLSTALRDKVRNGDPFLHVELKVEVEKFEDVLGRLKEQHEFSCPIRSISWDHDLRLPKAPAWAWRWSYTD